ncbi:DUF4884 domain-containing protein [Paraflavitalea pollutisoli]|uniref:DUF4884 domain-containing protein n=1 Tax=Paraflavitalea pollutisoli TaxID=3034143 RepID=UPI0023EBD2ED|nr:DUF4884 domain-containing protein [Paraflavitalea sp. H1-2-19X]
MWRIIPVLAIVAIASCRVQQPLYSKPSENNGTYRVQYLFEHEGCKVYRFYDMGNYVYFTNCPGEAIAKTDSTSLINRTQLASKDLHSRVHQQ